MPSLFGSAIRVVTRCFVRWNATEQKPRSCQTCGLVKSQCYLHPVIAPLLHLFLTLKRVTNRRPPTKKWSDKNLVETVARWSLTRAYESEVYFYCTFRQGSVRKSVYMARGFLEHTKTDEFVAKPLSYV